MLKLLQQFKASLDPLIRLVDPPHFSFVSASKRPVPLLSPPYDDLLHNLCNVSLVSKDWHDASAPYLWSTLRIGFPRSFEQLLEIIGGPQEERDRLARILSNSGLITPPASRDVSRTREVSRTRSMSRGRERFLSPVRLDSPGSEASSFDWGLMEPSDNGLLIRQLSFADFRTAGLGRTGRQGSRERFVTPSRVLHLMRGTRALREYAIESALEHLEDIAPEGIPEGKLTQLGLTEYMDSSELLIKAYSQANLWNRKYAGLTLEVLEEILLRGQPTAKPTIASISTPLKALDLCGCTSSIVTEALQDFVELYMAQNSAPFKSMLRLGLFGVSTLKGDTLRAFVCGFPSLTHLDLSRTQANDALLTQLAAAASIDLQALSLARCPAVSGVGIIDILCGVKGKKCVTRNLRDLSLAGNHSNITNISAGDLEAVLDRAPCFRSGKLRSLDLSSCPLNDQILLRMPPSQRESNGALIQLGLAYCRRITIPGLAAFLENNASSVEVLDLTKSCEPRHPFGRFTTTPCIDTFLLHTLVINKVAKGEIGSHRTRITNLRVIELEDSALDSLGGGTQGWLIIFGRGRRSVSFRSNFLLSVV